ncbi:hypothetical protein D8X77_17905 [Vibrio vulnificus]|nr:hypothetical protein [Vibrio vulnificus]
MYEEISDTEKESRCDVYCQVVEELIRNSRFPQLYVHDQAVTMKYNFPVMFLVFPDDEPLLDSFMVDHDIGFEINLRQTEMDHIHQLHTTISFESLDDSCQLPESCQISPVMCFYHNISSSDELSDVLELVFTIAETQIKPFISHQ